MTLTDEALDALEQKAKAATPGPWTTMLCGDGAEGWLRDSAGNFLTVGYEGEIKANDVTFIAAANPETVAALVAEVRTLRRREKETRRVAVQAACAVLEAAHDEGMISASKWMELSSRVSSILDNP